MVERKHRSNGIQSVEIQNVDKVLNYLSILEKKLQGKVIRTANREGAKVFLAEAKANAPKKTGTLKRSLKIKTPRAKSDRVSVMIGTGSGFSSNFGGSTFYGAFINFGTKKITANPFLTNAYKEKGTYVERLVLSKIEEGVKQTL